MFRKGLRPRLATAIIAMMLVAPVAASALPLDRPLGGGATIADLGNDVFAWLEELFARVFGTSDEGSIIDPNGGQGGSGGGGTTPDPDGGQGGGEEGSIIDPNGGQGDDDEGSIIDPNG